MFIKKEGHDFLIAQVYVDDIIFEGQPLVLIANYVEQMKFEFKMSMVGIILLLGFLDSLVQV